MDLLYDDVLKIIISFCDLPSLGRLSQTSKRFFEILKDENMWVKYLNQYGCSIKSELAEKILNMSSCATNNFLFLFTSRCDDVQFEKFVSHTFSKIKLAIALHHEKYNYLFSFNKLINEVFDHQTDDVNHWKKIFERGVNCYTPINTLFITVINKSKLLTNHELFTTYETLLRNVHPHIISMIDLFSKKIIAPTSFINMNDTLVIAPTNDNEMTNFVFHNYVKYYLIFQLSFLKFKKIMKQAWKNNHLIIMKINNIRLVDFNCVKIKTVGNKLKDLKGF